jgi:hypothetical protein
MRSMHGRRQYVVSNAKYNKSYLIVYYYYLIMEKMYVTKKPECQINVNDVLLLT